MVTASQLSTDTQEKTQSAAKPEPESDAESDPEFVNNTPYVYERKGKGRGKGTKKGKEKEEVNKKTRRGSNDRPRVRRSTENTRTQGELERSQLMRQTTYRGQGKQETPLVLQETYYLVCLGAVYLSLLACDKPPSSLLFSFTKLY